MSPWSSRARQLWRATDELQVETAHAWRLAGADVADIVPIWEWAAGRASLDGYDAHLPGGFMDGDDLGSARACATACAARPRPGGPTMPRISVRLPRRLVLGICNGFHSGQSRPAARGARPAPDDDVIPTSADYSRIAGYGCWPSLALVFTRGLSELELPVRHGEWSPDVSLTPPPGGPRSTAPAPAALRAVGVSDRPLRSTRTAPRERRGALRPDGRIFGLMPHPERSSGTQHPRWSRDPATSRPAGAGLRLFRNAVETLRA